MDTECGDFTKAAFQAQTDGALFYKTSEGRKDIAFLQKRKYQIQTTFGQL